MSQFYQKDDVNRRPITIVEDKESFYKLSDGQMIKKDVFPKYYMPFMNESVAPKFNSDHIDPESFFNTSHVIPVEKLKTVDTSRMTDRDDMAGATIVKNTTNQVQHTSNYQPSVNENLVRPAPVDQPIPNHTNTDVSQYKVYDNDDDAYNDFVKNSQHTNQQSQQPQQQVMMSEIEVLFENEKLAFGEEEAHKRRETRLKRTNVVQNSSDGMQNNQTGGSISPYPPTQQRMDDPSEVMFKTFKRNHNISINITFNDKIGKPDFVKMMIENMEGDIIQYYKKVIMSNIMKNIKHIEDEVEKNLRLEIFGEEDEEITQEDIDKVIKEKSSKKKRVIPKVPKEERSQINEGVDEKKEPIKKVRIKKDKSNTTNSSKEQTISLGD